VRALFDRESSLRERLPRLLLVGCFCLAFAAGASARPQSGATPPEDEIPFGIASSWLVGHQMLAEGDPAGALPYLHLAYRSQPDVAVVALDFQEALAAEGYLRDALGVMDKLVEAAPDSASYRLRRAALYLRAGDSEQALKDLRELRDRGVVSLEVITTEAAILTAAGRSDQALDVYRDGLHLLPERGAEIYLGMAGVMQQTRQEHKIPELMEEAQRSYPDDPSLWLVQVRALAALGRDDQALEVAQAADEHFQVHGAAGDPVEEVAADLLLEEDSVPEPAPEDGGPVLGSFLVELADFYAQHGALDKAVGILQPQFDAGTLGRDASLWLGRLLLGTGRHEEAAALIAQMVEQWPASGRARFLEGKMSEGAGQWEEAIVRYRRAADLASQDPEIRLAMVRAMLVAWERDLDHRNPERSPERTAEFRHELVIATGLIHDADWEGQLVLGYAYQLIGAMSDAAYRFELAGRDPQLRITATLQRSICLDEQGQPERALTVLEDLQGDFPADAEVANSLGYFLAEKNQDLERAERLVRQALAVEGGNGAYLDSLGWVYYRMGRYDDSLDYLIRAANVLPEDPVILEHLGMALLRLGQGEEALDVLRRSLAVGGDRERIEAVIAEITSSRDSDEDPR